MSDTESHTFEFATRYEDGFICGWHGLTGARTSYLSGRMLARDRMEWVEGYAHGAEMRARYGELGRQGASREDRRTP